MEQRSELLPCPFCGEMPAVEMTGFHLGARTIYCAGNDCMGPSTTAQNMDDATIQWNRRATQPAAPAGDAVAWGRVIDGKAVTISLVRTEANDEPLYAAPAQSAEGRVPKVRTSHHRNKEEAERLQKLVNERYAQCSAGNATVSIKPMGLSDGRTDYFVLIKVGDREVTPHVFREEYKAAYHVALYDWLLNGSGEEPCPVDFGPDDWPARTFDAAQPKQDPLRKALADLVEINRRDETTNPDLTATDTWRAEAWQNAKAALALTSTELASG